MGFVADLPTRVILDEVQRVPALFTALKMEVDRRRLPGRFLLTGSSNVLHTPALSDSLAGRMETIRLHPLAQCERKAVRAHPSPWTAPLASLASLASSSAAASRAAARSAWVKNSSSGSYREAIPRRWHGRGPAGRPTGIVTISMPRCNGTCPRSPASVPSSCCRGC